MSPRAIGTPSSAQRLPEEVGTPRCAARFIHDTSCDKERTDDIQFGHRPGYFILAIVESRHADDHACSTA